MKILGNASRWILNKAMALSKKAQHFTNFIASRSSYAQFTTPISLSVAYKIRIDIQTSSGGTRSVLGQGLASTSSLDILFNNKIRLNVDGTNVQTTLSLPTDDVIREITVELSGNDFIFSTDGVLFETVTSVAASNKSFQFDVVAQSNSGKYFDGYIANLHAEQSAVVVASLAMDESFAEPAFINSVDALNPATKYNISADQVIEVLV